MNAGDKVKIITDSEEFEGILMPRPDLLDKDITVIKLKTGYNLGIDNKKIKKTELIEKYTTPEESKTKLKIDKNLPTVAILSTGGTISSKVDYRTGGVYADYTAEDFVAMMPELSKIANIKTRKVLSIMSENYTSKEWTLLAKEVVEELNDPNVKGVIITQGTDTLHFSSAALSFLLNDLNKPVILTASQRSIDRGSSDAFLNLFCSITAAVNFNAAEVMTCLHGSTNDDFCLLIKGSKVRKMHTSRRDAFRPINSLPIAKISADGQFDILSQDFRQRKEIDVKIDSGFEADVGLLYTYPGIKPEVVDFYKDYKGLVIVGTGLGNIPINLLESVQKLNIPVVITSQTIYGKVHPLVYTNLRELSIKLNCIFVEDLLPETAFVKLSWILSKTNEIKEIKKLMLKNIVGEFNQRSLPTEFLY